MGMINGKRILSQLVAGTMSGAQLQTELGTATSLASFSEAINDAENARLLAESRTAMTALTASVIAMTAVGASSTAVKAIAVLPAAASAVCAVKTALMAMGSSSGALLRFFRWTQRTTPAAFNALAYGNNMLVGWSATSIYSSSDLGVTWTARTNPNGLNINSGSGLTFGNGRFVAVNTTGSSNLSCQSVDGITWTAMPLPTTSGWNTVVECNDCFLAFGGDTNAAYSLNGTSWTAWSATSYTGACLPVKTLNGLIATSVSYVLYITPNSFSAPVIKSSTLAVSTVVGFTPAIILAGNGIVLAFQGGSSSNYSRSLDDGASFTRLNLPSAFSSSDKAAGGFANGVFYIVNTAEGMLYQSVDGLTWIACAASYINNGIARPVGGLVGITGSGHITLSAT